MKVLTLTDQKDKRQFNIMNAAAKRGQVMGMYGRATSFQELLASVSSPVPVGISGVVGMSLPNLCLPPFTTMWNARVALSWVLSPSM